MTPDDLVHLFERCESDDELERFEAFEDLWAEVLNQGTPGDQVLPILSRLMDRVKDRRPEWPVIVEGLCGCSIDLAEGPTRASGENQSRISALGAIIQRRSIFEEVMKLPCNSTKGSCRLHGSLSELLRVTAVGTAQAEDLCDSLLGLIRKNEQSHVELWPIVERLSAIDHLSAEELAFCVGQREVPGLRRAALVRLASLGDAIGLGNLAKRLDDLEDPFVPTPEESAILVRTPQKLPFNILTKLYQNAQDLRSVHDLACGILRKASDDARTGWTTVSETRARGLLSVTHPNVEPFEGLGPSAEAYFYRGDLLRKNSLSRIQTDVFELLGLPPIA